MSIKQRSRSLTAGVNRAQQRRNCVKYRVIKMHVFVGWGGNLYDYNLPLYIYI